MSRRVGAGGLRAGVTQRLNAPRGRLLAAVRCGASPCHRLVHRRRADDRRSADGDQRRQVEKLSPGMCTGWGDLVSTGVLEGLRRPNRASAGPSFDRSGSDVNPLADLHVLRKALLETLLTPAPARSTWASTGDEPGVERGQTVDDRRPLCTAVESSTCRQQDMGGRPTAGQQPHSTAEQRKEARSPASTPVMTRMR
jgi:hypothetical protein